MALGRKLFFHPILSEDGSQSCASRHEIQDVIAFLKTLTDSSVLRNRAFAAP
jgi:cytochrome c peroxidase